MSNGFTQPPVTVPVNASSPVKISMGTPPYTIINLSTEGTAWIADNTGVVVGNGTPVYPGTSLLWEKTADVWAVGDSAFLIQATKDISEWQPNPIALAVSILNTGLILIDNPLMIMDESSFSGTSAEFDTSKHNTLHLTINTASAGGEPYNFTIIFGHADDPAHTFEVPIRIPSLTVSDVNIAIPIVGDIVSFTADVAFSVKATLHNRMHPLRQSLGTVNLIQIFQTIVAATTLSTMMLPYFGDMEIDVDSPAANAGSLVQVERINPSTGLWVAVRSGVTVVRGARAGYDTRISNNGEGMRLSVTNGVGPNAQFDIRVCPVLSPGGIV